LSLADLTTTFERWQRSRSRRQIARGYSRLIACVSHLMRDRRIRERIEADRSQLHRSNPEEWKASDTRRATSGWTLVLALPAVYAIDYSMLAPMTAWIAAGSFAKNSWGIELIKIAVPLALVTLEMTIALFLQSCYQNRHWPNSVFWALVACAIATATPAILLATSYARQATLVSAAAANPELASRVGNDILGLDPKLYWTTMALITFALVAHVTVLAGGGRLHDAKAFMVFRRRQRKMNARLLRLETAAVAGREETSNAFRGFARGLADHNERFGEVLPAGPFPREVALFLNEMFEQEVIAIEARRSPRPRMAEPAPESAIPAGAEAETTAEADYLRAVLDRRTLEADAEVRP